MTPMYLTLKEKKRHLREFRREQATRNVDIGAIESCNDLNGLPGVVVTQCCIGHMVKPHPEGMTGTKEGYISLRLSAARGAFFLGEILVGLLLLHYVTSVFITWEMIEDEIRPRHVVTFEPGRLTDVADTIVLAFVGEES